MRVHAWHRRTADDHKSSSYGNFCLMHLTYYADQAEQLVQFTVTGDETWISHTTFKTRLHQLHIQRNVVINNDHDNCFWDHKVVLLVDFLNHDDTISAKCSCGTTETLWQDIHHKRPGLVIQSIITSQDNARSPITNRYGCELWTSSPATVT